MECIHGKVALITGGAGGIGRCMVKKLLQNGAKGVAIVDISEASGQNFIEEILNEFGRNKFIFIRTDVTVKKELEEAFETTIKTFAQLDIVINNAGILDEIAWHKTISINLIALIEATYLAMQNYFPKFKSGKEGIIVNTSSVVGLQASATSPVYCATKHGIIGLSRTLSGLVRTAMTLKEPEDRKIFFPEKLSQLQEVFKFKAQSPETVGEALIEVIKNGRNGSIWVSENDEPPYEVIIPILQDIKIIKK